MTVLYEKFKKYAVLAASLEDFRQRYTKPDRYALRGPEYVSASSRLPARIWRNTATPLSAATTALPAKLYRTIPRAAVAKSDQFCISVSLPIVTRSCYNSGEPITGEGGRLWTHR